MTLRSLTSCSLCLLAPLLNPTAHAQTTKADYKGVDCSTLSPRTAVADCTAANLQVKTIYLTNAIQPNDANEILVAVRNMFDPSIKVYLVASQNAINVGTYPQEITRIEALVHELDRPRKAYRITYTIATIEDGKNVGTQHYSMVAVDGQRVTMKQGDKVPVATGSYSTDSSTAQTQFTYLDVGMNFDTTVTSIAGGVSIISKAEQSSIGPTNTIAGVAEPVVRQSVLQSSASVTLGKPLMLGSIDIPNSNRHLDLDVLVEPIR
jgi:type II secretory pathway component GspD/PulD (secretin)